MHLGSLEERLMNHLWSSYKDTAFTVRAVVETINTHNADYAYNTILTVMTHLHKKGLLKRTKQGKTYEYTLKLSQSDYVAEASKRAFETLKKQYGSLAVAHFANLIESVDPKLLNEARAHLKKHTPNL